MAGPTGQHIMMQHVKLNDGQISATTGHNQHKSMYLYRTTHSEQVELAYNHMVVIRLFIALICSNNEYS